MSGAIRRTKRRQPVPRPCHSAPKLPLVRSLRRVACGGHAEPSYGLVVGSCRGQRTRHRYNRVLQEPGRPCSSPLHKLARGCQSRKLQASSRRRACGRNEHRRTGVVSPSEGNEVRREGHRASEHFIVPSTLGHSDRGDPVEGRECRATEPLAGNLSRSPYLGFR